MAREARPQQDDEPRLSRPALETLAIIAYRQPVSRPEVDAVRGVNSEGVLDNLLERRMIRIAGRKDSPGGRSSTRPRASSSSPSDCATSTTCRRSRAS